MIHFLYNWFLTQKNVKDNSIKKFVFWKLYRILKYILPLYYKTISVSKLPYNVDNDVVVSLTSFPARIEIVYLTLKSIFVQSYKPNKIVLYLADSQFINKELDLPVQLLDLKKKGLIIKFCEDIKPHKKYFYSFKEYSNSKIVLIDDDVIYPKDFLKTLIDNSKKHKNCVIANRIREIKYVNKKLLPYRSWEINGNKLKNPSKFFFPTGVGGVLYSPSFFNEKLYDLVKIKRLCINADDVWLKANSIDKEVLFTNKYLNSFIELPNSQRESLFSNNVFFADNDTQILNVFNHFNINEENFK